MLISAGALLGWYSDALSDFEVETIATIAGRWLEHRSQTVLTAAEWAVVEASVEASVEAMRAVARRPLVERIAA